MVTVTGIIWNNLYPVYSISILRCFTSFYLSCQVIMLQILLPNFETFSDAGFSLNLVYLCNCNDNAIKGWFNFIHLIILHFGLLVPL